MGSGCGSVGRAVASKYQRSAVRIQTLVNFYRTFNSCRLCCFEKTKIKEKEAGNGHLKNFLWLTLRSNFCLEKTVVIDSCGQSYKASTIVNYDSGVVIWGIFKSGTTFRLFIRLATGDKFNNILLNTITVGKMYHVVYHILLIFKIQL